MAEHFQRAVRLLQRMIQEPEADEMVRMAVVQSLTHHRAKRFPWSDRTCVLTLIEGVNDYGPDQGLPGDIMAINVATLIRGSERIPLAQRVTIQEMRALHFNGTSSGYPDLWCLYGGRWLVYPTPSNTDQVQFDYRSDISRDELSGAVIGIDSTRETNELIKQGQGPLLTYAAYWYCLTVQRDAARAQMFSQLYKSEMEPFQMEADLKDMSGTQFEAYF